MKTEKHRHHSCSCEHKSVKHCGHCKTVFCEDCNQEWTVKPTYTWYQNPYTTLTTGGVYQSAASTNFTVGDLLKTEVTCNHSH